MAGFTTTCENAKIGETRLKSDRCNVKSSSLTESKCQNPMDDILELWIIAAEENNCRQSGKARETMVG